MTREFGAAIPTYRAFAITCVAALVLGCSAVGVEEEHACHLVGCVDQLSISLRTSDGRWEVGQYELVIDGDIRSTRASCRFRMPDAIPNPPSITRIECSDSLTAHIEQDSTCTQRRPNIRLNEPCVPLDGGFVVLGQIQGTPRTLMLRLTPEGTPISTRTITPKYEQFQPNGPECEPTCNHADVPITF